uniref:Uncharacterized protein n=1 Tax=Triticum urartu TaxID=4572 RepID=A0A8R7PCS2_TRIUA
MYLCPPQSMIMPPLISWELQPTLMINQFNWCEYVLECLLAGVRRLKNDILSNNPATNLFGCHLFLQIFLLDNLDLGMFNKPHTVLPRVSVFYQDSLCGMTNMATDVGKGGYFLCFRTVTPPVNCLLCPFQALCRLAVRVKKHRKITGLAITFMRW